MAQRQHIVWKYQFCNLSENNSNEFKWEAYRTYIHSNKFNNLQYTTYNLIDNRINGKQSFLKTYAVYFNRFLFIMNTEQFVIHKYASVSLKY